LESLIEARTAVCGVIGLGFIGATVARALRTAGFPVTGVDRDTAIADAFGERDSAVPSSTDTAALADADVVVIAVRVAPSDGARVDTEPLEAAVRAIASLPEKARLSVLVSTVPPGTTRMLVGDVITGEDQFLVHAPERLQVDDTIWTIDRIPHVVGGIDADSTRLGAQLLACITDSVVPVDACEIAEIAKLLENSSNAVGIALVAEVTALARAHGVDMAAVTAAAATKPFGYRPFHPGPGIGGHCIPNDVRMLRDAALAAGVPARVLAAAVDVSHEMPAQTVDRVEELLAARGHRLDGHQVLLVGLGFKVGTADTAATPAVAIARELRRRGATPIGVDSRVAVLDVDGELLERIDPEALGSDQSFAAAIVLTGDPAVQPQQLHDSATVVLDAGGGRALASPLEGAARL
jgi:nucleotide sugar dehydrogenase